MDARNRVVLFTELVLGRGRFSKERVRKFPGLKRIFKRKFKPQNQGMKQEVVRYLLLG